MSIKETYHGLLKNVAMSDLKSIKIAVKRHYITTSLPPGPIQHGVADPRDVVPCVHYRTGLANSHGIFDRDGIVVNQLKKSVLADANVPEEDPASNSQSDNDRIGERSRVREQDRSRSTDKDNSRGRRRRTRSPITSKGNVSKDYGGDYKQRSQTPIRRGRVSSPGPSHSNGRRRSRSREAHGSKNRTHSRRSRSPSSNRYRKSRSPRRRYASAERDRSRQQSRGRSSKSPGYPDRRRYLEKDKSRSRSRPRVERDKRRSRSPHEMHSRRSRSPSSKRRSTTPANHRKSRSPRRHSASTERDRRPKRSKGRSSRSPSYPDRRRYLEKHRSRSRSRPRVEKDKRRSRSPHHESRSPRRYERDRISSATRRSSRSPHTSTSRHVSSRRLSPTSIRDKFKRGRSRSPHKEPPPLLNYHSYYEGIPGDPYWIGPPRLPFPGMPPRFFPRPQGFYPPAMADGYFLPPRYPPGFLPFRQRLPFYNSIKRPEIRTVKSSDSTSDKIIEIKTAENVDKDCGSNDEDKPDKDSQSKTQ